MRFKKVNKAQMVVNVILTGLICIAGVLIADSYEAGKYMYLVVGLFAASISVELK